MPKHHSLPALQLGDLEIALGDAVVLSPEDDEEEEADDAAPLALVQAMWQTADGEAQCRPAEPCRGAR